MSGSLGEREVLCEHEPQVRSCYGGSHIPRLNCVVPENTHTPPRKGLEIPGGGGGWGGGFQRPRNFRMG